MGIDERMAIKTLKTIHEDDWRNTKKDYAFLKSDKDISKRMELLVGFFKEFKPRRILDVGCGSGYWGHLVKQIDSNVTIRGFDISEYAISKIESYDKVYPLDIDKEDIPEESNYFDMVVCAEVLEHIYDVDHCLDEIKRVLKPGGKAIITTPNLSYWGYRIVCFLGRIPNILKDPRHIHAFNHDFLSDKCNKKNFNIAYSIEGRKDSLSKMSGKIFNKTVILILTKKNYEQSHK